MAPESSMQAAALRRDVRPRLADDRERVVAKEMLVALKSARALARAQCSPDRLDSSPWLKANRVPAAARPRRCAARRASGGEHGQEGDRHRQLLRASKPSLLTRLFARSALASPNSATVKPGLRRWISATVSSTGCTRSSAVSELPRIESCTSAEWRSLEIRRSGR